MSRDEILRNDPDLLSDIENEAEKMRLEQRRLEEEIAEMQVKLDEEREKAGEKVKGAFFKIQEEAGEEFEDGTGVEEEIRMDTIDGDNMETIDLDEEQFSADKAKAPKNEIEHSQVISKKNSFLDSKEIMSEFRNQVKNDVHNLIGFIFPKPIRDPLIGALRPVIRIVKNAGINTYDLLKRYVTVTVDKNGESNAPEEGIKV